MNRSKLPDPRQPIVDLAQALPRAIALQRQGQVVAAERLYAAILEANPHHFDALNNFGLLRLQQGKTAESAALLRRALEQNRGSAEAHYNFANALRELGRHNDAIAQYGEALVLRPDIPELHNNLAIALEAAGRYDVAAQHYERAVALRPTYAEAHYNLANTLRALGRKEAAVLAFERALAIRPDLVEAHNGLGKMLVLLNRPHEAISHFERALALRADFPETHNNLGNGLQALQRYAKAIEQYRRALEIAPNYAEAHYNLANSLKALGRCDDAVAHYENALAIRPDLAEAHNNLGNALVVLNRPERAIEHYERAIAIRPDLAEAHNNLGKEWAAVGQLDRAREAFASAVALAPRRTDFYRDLAEVKHFSVADSHLATMERLAQDFTSLSEEAQIDLHFALGKAWADVGEYERSFRHVLAGNALKRKRIDYNEAATLAVFERIHSVFTASLMLSKAGAGNPSAAPVFILGMPRSGSTLVEQILASHRDVFGAGEITDFREVLETLAAPEKLATYPEQVLSFTHEKLSELGSRYLRRISAASGRAARITDKLPHNFLLVGLIHLALPNARIIHTRRDPVDTCLSYFSKLFTGKHPYTNDLAELGRYYRAYSKLMDHWHDVLPPGVILDVQYEAVVADLETQARRMVAHCGLAWDDACLSFHKTERVVRTGSTADVREPIYQTSVGRARRYGDLLQPLHDALEIE